MFRLVADITELNIDQVKLPKIPGLGMLMKLPNKQKISIQVWSATSRWTWYRS